MEYVKFSDNEKNVVAEADAIAGDNINTSQPTKISIWTRVLPEPDHFDYDFWRSYENVAVVEHVERDNVANVIAEGDNDDT